MLCLLFGKTITKLPRGSFTVNHETFRWTSFSLISRTVDFLGWSRGRQRVGLVARLTYGGVLTRIRCGMARIGGLWTLILVQARPHRYQLTVDGFQFLDLTFLESERNNTFPASEVGLDGRRNIHEGNGLISGRRGRLEPVFLSIF